MLALLMPLAVHAQGYKVVVMSDPHLLAPSLWDDGEASTTLARSETKLVLESDSIMGAMVDEIVDMGADLLLVSGDLTYNGSLESHRRFVSHLDRLASLGVPTLVIPGNHDVNNPYSRSYKGQSATPVASVGAAEFARLYERYGYGAGSSHDSASLSYMCEPLPGLRLLCLDSNRYDTVGEYHSGGRVKASTLAWAAAQLKSSGGRRVLAMMHHHAVEHVDGESRLLPDYIVSNHDEVCSMLRDGGVNVCLTGHLHITDAATDDGLTDISTGAASTWPLPLRVLDVDPTGDTLNVETVLHDSECARHKLASSTVALTGMVSRRLWPKFSSRLEQVKPLFEEQGIDLSSLPATPQELSLLLQRHMRQPLEAGLLAVTRGGEDSVQAQEIMLELRHGVESMVSELMPEHAEEVSAFVLKNLWPRVEPILRSALEDINRLGTPRQSVTPDHHLRLAF